VFIGLGVILVLLMITLGVTTRLTITQRRALETAAALQLETKANSYTREATQRSGGRSSAVHRNSAEVPGFRTANCGGDYLCY
jgi:hypothetical protein